jgi:chromosome segregation ATPase
VNPDERIAELLSENDRLVSELAAKDHAIKDLRQGFRTEKEDRLKAEEARLKAERKQLSLEDGMAQLEAQNSDLSNSLGSLKRKFEAQLHEEQSRRRKAVGQVKEEVAHLKAQNSDLSNSLGSLERKFKSEQERHLSELSEAADHMETVEEENKALRAKLKRMQDGTG